MQTMIQNRIDLWSNKQTTQRPAFLYQLEQGCQFPDGGRGRSAQRCFSQQSAKGDFAALMSSWREALEEHPLSRTRWTRSASCEESPWEISLSTTDATSSFVPELESEFTRLAQQWYRETAMISMMHKKIMHQAYQRIIGMGKEALPLIFRELTKKRGHWLWALCAITGEDAAKPGDNFPQAVEAWLRWGKEHGYV